VKPSLYLHALRVARARQLRGRLTRVATRRIFPGGTAPALVPPAGPVPLWRSRAFEPMRLVGDERERLAGFHAHYGEDALGAARDGDVAGVRSAMQDWVDANPPRASDAWHPYTVSTRVGNWLAALALASDASTRPIQESVWRQLRYLALNVENDILGNHVIRNARGLLLGGLAFDSQQLVAQARSLLERELPEQILPDGGHYERSPVYHAVVLRDLLEMEAALPGTVSSAVLERMRRFAADLSRPDGAPALFNDGGLDLAPRLDLPEPRSGVTVFSETGYVVVRRGALWLAFDCGPPAPAYLPAHAHADALSFQLWVDGAPVVVDPGTPTYEAGARRDRCRSTEAHSTVAIDGKSQFEPWGAFRSGPLPDVELREASEHLISGGVTWRCGTTHQRVVTFDQGELVVTDSIAGGRSHEIVSSLPLGPDTDVDVRAEGTLTAVREQRDVSERFHVGRPAPAIVLRGRITSSAEFGWRLPLA
jgi:hypothetical protein